MIFPLAIKPFFLRFYGGNDGARTRDLCRDIAEACGEFHLDVKPATERSDLRR